MFLILDDRIRFEVEVDRIVDIEVRVAVGYEKSVGYLPDNFNKFDSNSDAEEGVKGLVSLGKKGSSIRLLTPLRIPSM